MWNSICCCDRRPAKSARSAATIIGVSLALVGVSLLLEFVFDQHTLSQALLFSSFPIALVTAEAVASPGGEVRSTWRRAGLVLAAVITFLSFLAVVFILSLD